MALFLQMRTSTQAPSAGSPIEAAIAVAAGYACIHSAKEALKLYMAQQEARKCEREEKRRLKRQKDGLRKLAAMWVGVWAWKELIAGRLIGDFREMSPGVLQAMCQTLDVGDGGNMRSLPDAMPFPVEKLLSYAGNLTEAERETIGAIYAGMSPRGSSERNIASKLEDWRRVPAVKIVDLRLLSPAEAKKRADKLADAVDKYLHRPPISFTPLANDTPETTQFIGEYVGRVRLISPRLARSFNKLAQAFCAGAIKAQVFESYLTDIPVLPPDEVRFLFRKKILWVSEHEES
ncbi:hypothetical protein BH09VER1_BH09VER1_47650 [soil metagenome]